jgi:general stress protein YciG
MDEVPGEEDEQKGGYYRVGFAAMPKERVRQIARKGGRHSHGYGDEGEEGEGEEDYRLGEEDEERYPMLKPSANRARRSGYAY